MTDTKPMVKRFSLAIKHLSTFPDLVLSTLQTVLIWTVMVSVIRDLDGSFTEQNSARSLVSLAEFEWGGDRRRGLGRFPYSQD